MNRAKLSKKDVAFWNEVERAAFLIQNLNDGELVSEQSRTCLNQIGNDKIDACLRLYEAWAYIKDDVDKATEVGYRFEPYWLYKLEAANDHIFARCIRKLDPAEQEYVYACQLDILKLVQNTTVPLSSVGLTNKEKEKQAGKKIDNKPLNIVMAENRKKRELDRKQATA